MDLIDIFRTFHPNAEEYTFFSSAHVTFSGIDNILGKNSAPYRILAKDKEGKIEFIKAEKREGTHQEWMKLKDTYSLEGKL